MKKILKQIIKNEQGIVATLSLLGVSVISLAIVATLANLALGELKISNTGSSLEKTFYAAEAGLNEALYRLIQDPIPGNRILEIDGITIEITVSSNPDNPFQRIIQSKATSPTGKVRIVQIIANTNSFAGGFDYAVQGGTNGIHLDNNSEIEVGGSSYRSIIPTITLTD